MSNIFGVFYRPSDAYHTLYSLSGLATAQHRVTFSDTTRDELFQSWKMDADDAELNEMHKLAFAHARAWVEEPGGSLYAGTAADRVVSIYPSHSAQITPNNATFRTRCIPFSTSRSRT